MAVGRMINRKNVLDHFENVLFCMILMKGMGAPGSISGLLPPIVVSGWNAVNTFSSLAFAAIILCRSRGRAPKAYLRVYLFGIYVFFTGLLVSNFSQSVLINSGKLLLTMLCSVYFGSTRSKQETVNIIAISQLIVSLMIVYMILIGYGGVAVSDGLFAFNLIGLYTTKNSCGYEMVFGALIFYFCFRDSKGFWKKLFWLALALGQFYLSTLSRAVGATATGLLTIVIFEVFLGRKGRIDLAKFYIGVNTAFWVFVGAVLPSVGFLLHRIGKSVTLAGRTLIWKSIIIFVSGIHRWLGYGYGGFWDNAEYTDSLYELYHQFAFRSGIVGGHNLVMELYINIGIIGVLLFFVMVCTFLKKSKQCDVRDMGFEIICLSFLAIRGLMERTLNATTYDTMALFLVMGSLTHTAAITKKEHQNEGVCIENWQEK